MSDADMAATVLVTGASRGIGRAVAVALAAGGWQVALLGRDAVELARTAALCSPTVSTTTIVADIRQPAEVADAVAAAEAELGPLHGLVNNAGVQRAGPAAELTSTDLDDIIDTNLKGAFLCAQAVGRSMIADRKGGSMVNIASAAGVVGTTGRAAYAASKAGLIMLTRALAREWAPHRIRVNAVAPTYVDTELGRQTLNEPATREAIIAAVPLGRIAAYDDIIPSVSFLLDRAASGFITGQVIGVDGGLSA